MLIISAFPPHPAPEANHGLHICEQLARRGHAVHVLCKKGSIAATQPNMVVHPVMEGWTWSDLPSLVQCLKECRPDVVLLLYIGWVFDYQPMITSLPTICKKVLPGVPCVTQFENVDGRAPRRPFLARAWRKAMGRWAGKKDVYLFGTLLRDSVRIIALSSPHRARLMRHYPGVEEKSVILPPPPFIRMCSDPPATARKRARAAIGAAERDFVWIYWGYIYPRKGVETLLHAFRIACRRQAKLRLVLVGGGLEIPNFSSNDYFHMVQGMSETLGIADRVTWTGPFDWDSEDGSLYLHAGDACVLPLDFGVALNNSSLAAASAHGLPIIGTELLGERDETLEHGRNIYLVQPRNPEMLAEALEVISESAALRERLRHGVRELARDWHRWETTTERLVGILESAVSGANVPGREQSQSYAAPKERESSEKRISSEMCLHDYDEALPGAPGDTPHLSSVVSSGETTPDKRTAPLVSVIVAAYNVEKYLGQCLDSLVNQTLKNIEIIVVNDASPDNSLAVMREYQARHHNLVVIDSKKNLGLGSARNLGLRAAQGEYIAFTDADDWADVRMCEVLYKRAKADDSEVLIADANVFYEDSKTFGQFFDQHIRKTLDARLRTMPFNLARNPHVLLLEPVAWTKLYKRSFLQKHAIQMEEGMSSFEDVVFHFSVLVKAKRISLIDDALIFYRQNRPGQISRMTSRKVFEVFDVFRKIHENLVACDAPDDVWAMMVKVQLRMFDWLLQDRVQTRHKRQFLATVAQQLQGIPEGGYRNFAREASPDELAKLFCMRRNWLHVYKRVTRQRWPMFPLAYWERGRGNWRLGALKRGFRGGLGLPRRRSTSRYHSFISKSLNLPVFEKKWQAVHDSLSQMTNATVFALQDEEPLVGVCRIHDQKLFLSRPDNSGSEDAIWRMQNDYYLSQTAVFREGDTVVDVGAHVGVVSIYLAKKYPFIKVYAIEPDPLNYACLKRNIEINEVTNVTAINRAVSGDGQKRTLYVDAWNRAWATIEARVAAASSHRVLRTVQVDTLTLERLFQDYEIEHCRLLKMTAPGAIKESLQSLTRSGCVDLLCGEVDLADCSRVQLEMASWRIARQHFWRTSAQHGDRTVHSWIHQIPTEIERHSSNAPLSISPSVRVTNLEVVN